MNAQTVEGEAYALVMDPLKRENLTRILDLLRTGVMEIRSAPLGGWSPDFTVFSHDQGPDSPSPGTSLVPSALSSPRTCLGCRFGHEEARRARLGSRSSGTEPTTSDPPSCG